MELDYDTCAYGGNTAVQRLGSQKFSQRKSNAMLGTAVRGKAVFQKSQQWCGQPSKTQPSG